MKLEFSDGLSNHSDFSNDSQSSQMSTTEYAVSAGNPVITPTTVSFIMVFKIH